ncbi:MAG: hypothetical protein C5B57_06415 [Blastocatellia bacterium]|nr:MAG: hypothetical protein C5B57_06415 [Blastocatellia bacterium]
MTPIKRATRRRPSYFRGQLLDETDFRLEQDYHRNAWHRHHTTFHSWGVIDGLTATLHQDTKVSVAPGTAIDSLGREIHLDEVANLDLAGFSAGETVYLTLSYEEEPGEPRPSEQGEASAARVLEYSVLSASRTPGAGGAVTLARITLNAAGSEAVSYDDTPYASSLVGAGRIGYRELERGLRSGWVRMPFKPFPLEDKKPFRIGPTEARSTDEGAAGSMAIPVPPGATRVQRFRIAGEKNEGAIKVEFFRCGWNPIENDHEKSNILLLEFDPKSPTVSQVEYSSSSRIPGAFKVTAPLEGEIDAQYHALSVVITVTKKTSISLIAVEFGYPGGGANDDARLSRHGHR